MSEHNEQVAVMQWARLMQGQFPELALLHSIPNQNLLFSKLAPKARMAVINYLKAEGLLPGVPDLSLPVARHGYHGVYIEMKFGKNGPSDEQVKILESLAEQGYLAIVCWSAQDAIEAITAYLSGQD